MAFAINAPLDASLNNFSLEYSYGELLEATSSFDIANRIGKGTYGEVFRGIRRDGTDVAIKVLEMPDEAGFEEEVCVLSKFRHPNLVILMGFARRDSARYLIYEMLAGGDCFERLRKCVQQGQPFTWRERTSAAFDACCGLSHLHHATPKVFHRDIKTANILLDRNGTAKMADFGLACLSHAMAHKVEKTAGTTGYACPLYARRSVVTEGSEVYSFGIVMLEMLTNTCPAILLQHPDGSQQYKFLVCEIQGNVDIAIQMSDGRANWPLEAAGNIARIALRCVEDQEELRPNFVEIVNNLRNLRDYVPQEVRRTDRRLPSVTSETAHAEAFWAGSAPSYMPRQDYFPHEVHRTDLRPRAILEPAQGGESFGIPAHSYMPRQEINLVHRPVIHQVVSQSFAAPLVKQPQQLVPQPRPVQRLWSLKCVLAEMEHFHSLPQEQLTICHWQELDSTLATTLRVGRMFQEEIFSKLTSGFGSHVSREHFQIWAEEFDMPGIAERNAALGVPCSFFLTNFSINGTLVNGVNVEGKCGQVQLHHGDTIAIPRVVEESDGQILIVPLIQFQFDLSGSILRDMSFADGLS